MGRTSFEGTSQARLLGAVLLALGSCGGSAEAPIEAPRGALEGVVTLADSAAIESIVVSNTTDPEVCGPTQTLDDARVAVGSRGIENVLVALTGVPGELVPAPPPATLVLDNRDCRFRPHAAVTTVGSTLVATNSDPVLHTTHLYGPMEVNFSLPGKGVAQRRELLRPGLYAVRCDVHGWMQAYVRVDEHPFHAVTDEEGGFRIEGIPSGAYTLEAWHERLGSLALEVVVAPGVTAEVAIEYRPEVTR